MAGILAVTAPVCPAGQPGGEHLGHVPANVELSTAGIESGADPALEVRSAGGYIYVDMARPATVKIYTILGQLVSQQQLKAGTSRLRVKSRGIYILKTQNTTRRITV